MKGIAIDLLIVIALYCGLMGLVFPSDNGLYWIFWILAIVCITFTVYIHTKFAKDEGRVQK